MSIRERLVNSTIHSEIFSLLLFLLSISLLTTFQETEGLNDSNTLTQTDKEFHIYQSGTDIPNFGLVPRQSLRHELELLQDAGINSSEIIRIATINGAQALGISDKLGTVQAGKEANMIVLASNPLVNINNMQKIERVINEVNFVH